MKEDAIVFFCVDEMVLVDVAFDSQATFKFSEPLLKCFCVDVQILFQDAYGQFRAALLLTFGATFQFALQPAVQSELQDSQNPPRITLDQSCSF